MRNIDLLFTVGQLSTVFHHHITVCSINDKRGGTFIIAFLVNRQIYADVCVTAMNDLSN